MIDQTIVTLTPACRPVQPFRMNDAEWAGVVKFSRHQCPLPEGKRLLTITRKGTAIGNLFDVSCPCGKTCDITDYGKW